MSLLLRAPRIVTGHADLLDAWLLVDDAGTVVDTGTVVDAGTGSRTGQAPAADAVRHVDGTLVPGLVDLHCHGAVGHDFASAASEDVLRAAEHHRAAGTTALVASVATGTLPDTLAALHRLRPLVEDGVLAGIHLEGPWLSPARRGAHRPDLLHAPTPAEVRACTDAAGDALRIVTIAPELPGHSTPSLVWSPRVWSSRSDTPTPRLDRPAAPSRPAQRSSPTCGTGWPPCTTVSPDRSASL